MKVRLRPYNPAIGNVKRVHGAPFKDAQGHDVTYQAGVWYDLDDDETEAIEYLRSVRQVSRDPGSPLAFDVCTEEEAERVQAEEEVLGVVRRAEASPSPSAPATVKQRKDATLNAPRPKHELSAQAATRAKAKAKPKPATPSASKTSKGSKTTSKPAAKKAAPKRKAPRRKGST